MSLQFIMGPSGAGKSHYLYQNITKEAWENPQKNYIVLVPEQFTIQTQRDLVLASPRKGIMNVDVLSFGRLAHRIFEETGGNHRTVLDDVGKSLILRKIAGDCEEGLTILGSNLRKVGYISEIKSVISEFTQYDIREQDLEALQQQAGLMGNLSYKLQDIRTIYQGFQAYLKDRYITGEELLDVLAQVVNRSKILKGSVVVLDGFTGFTPVQNKLLRRLLGVCERVCVTVTMDERENPFVYQHPYQLFALSKEMVTSLVTIAQEEQVKVEDSVLLYQKPVYRFRERPELGFLERNLFRGGQGKWEQPQEAIQLFHAKNPREEMELAAQKVRYLVRTKGYRYREIAVIVSDMSSYANHMEKLFDKYQIPVFIDNKRSILLNSFVEYVRSLLGIAEQHFSYESVFRYMRSGMAGFSTEEIDIVENYVIALGIRGYKRWKEPWTRYARRMSEEELAYVNQIRERLIMQVDAVMEVLRKRSKTVEEVTRVLYEQFVREDLQVRLKEYEQRFQEAGELALEKEYAQVYRIVIELFDKFVELLGNEKITLKEYCELLDAGLEEAKVGVIPPSLDQVVVGDIERTRIKDVKAVFLLGMNDQFIPGNADKGSLLSEFDREKLKKSGLTLAPGAKEKSSIQKFYLYLLMTKPSEHLYLTYSQSSLDGKSLRPAYVIQDVKRMYPALREQTMAESLAEMELTQESGMSWLVKGLQKKGMGLSLEWQELYRWYKERPEWGERLDTLLEASFYRKPEDALTKRTAEQLYGKMLENSVSRLESFSACAYAHFLSYGLRLQEREEYRFQAIDMGNVFHSAIEYFSKQMEQEGYQWTNLTEEKMEEFVQYSVEQSVRDYGNTILYSSARNEYIVTRLKRMLHRTVWALTRQLEKGDFVPTGYEVSFGNLGYLSTANIALSDEATMRLRGKIDRIDVCEDGADVYVKVLDYKTGTKAFDLGELYYGLQMQLVIYMKAALEIEAHKHTEKRIIPAGIFYYQMKDPFVEKVEDEEQLEEQILKELRLDGLVNDSAEAVTHLDKEFDKNSLVIPVGRNKNQSLSKASKTVSGEEFSVISEYAMQKMKTIGSKIMDGTIAIDPFEMGTRNGCDYCQYQGICGFDTRISGYEYRRLEKWKKEDVLEQMRKEVSEWE